MGQVYTDLSREQRQPPRTFNGQVRDLIAELECTVAQAQREIDSLRREPFSVLEQKKLARQATDVKRAITLLKESILS